MFVLSISSQKQGTSAPMVGRKTTMTRTGSACNSRPRMRTGLHLCSTASGRPSQTRPRGCLRDHRTRKFRPASRNPQSSLSWASPANSATSRTMSIPSQYTPGRTSSSASRTPRLTTFKRYHLLTLRRVALNAIAGPTRCYRLNVRYLRGLSPVLWRGIEKCVEALRRM